MRFLLILALFLTAMPASAQESDWNSPRALELAERARERRASPVRDTSLMTYKAHAQGYVYFYLDRKTTEERTLVKVDQVALDIFWKNPGLTRQHIVGMRDKSRLPNRMYYHLDHLTVVQDEFGDLIRLGDGDEVRSVVHPAAPASGQVYDYRLADSLSLQLTGSEPVQVYELAVRPKDNKQAAFIGSMFVDRRTAAIVRMTFTFTPASYVDRRLDYINVSLDNALWQGRFWLPNEQRIEIRRQVPELDFPAGAVIRGVMRIGQYAFNDSIPNSFFQGPKVIASAKEQRESYAFEQGIYDDLATQGLAQPPEMASLRRMAAQLAREKYLSGLPRIRLHLPNASSAFRFNRAEGVFFGLGASYAASANTTLSLSAGYATGPDHPDLLAEVRHDATRTLTWQLQGYANSLRDVGPLPGAPGAWNTLAGMFAGRDYLDPYFVSGGSAGLELRLNPAWTLTAALSAQTERSAHRERSSSIFGSGTMPRVRAIEEGTRIGPQIALHREGSENAERTWQADVRGDVARFDPREPDCDCLPGDNVSPLGTTTRTFARAFADAAALIQTRNHASRLRVAASAGLATNNVPRQQLFLLGGRNTIPGYDYRSFYGTRMALLRAEAARDVIPSFLNVRLLANAGWTSAPDTRTDGVPADWSVTTTDGIRTSVGAGVGLLWDILRVDAVRGLNSGSWRWVFSVNPNLADIL